jgi:hypothetical protein
MQRYCVIMGVSWASAAIGKTLGGKFHQVEAKLLTTLPSQRQFQWGGGMNFSLQP